MIRIQVVPRAGSDVYGLLRDKTSPPTFIEGNWHPVLVWEDKPKPRIVTLYGNGHSREWGMSVGDSYIELSSADGILVADVHPESGNQYSLITRFVGSLMQWFPQQLFAINIHFVPEARASRKKRDRLRVYE
jgi:hypothetical protein